ncbi:MAG: beta-galactosidase [Verrucomicrobia bacterium]|nr:beta-galactosidase [Verrucomicrobiota bacterium]
MKPEQKIAVHRNYLTLDDKPFFAFGGDFNYARTPARHWRDRLLKMKAAGMNSVTFYITWANHEPQPEHYEWSGDKDVGAFLDLIHAEGMYAIARLGPFVHGESRNGGLPEWLMQQLGPTRVRSNDPEYLAHTRRWYEEMLKIIVPRQITRGGPIFMIQLENELGSAGSKGDDIPRGSGDPEENARHVLHYYEIVRQHGVDLPIVDINHWPGKEEKIQNLVDTAGGYPSACFACEGEIWPINQEPWAKHVRPCVTIETGASMFVRFFDLPPYQNTSSYQGPILASSHLESLSCGHIAEGVSGIHYYMVVDGQHPDDGNERMLPARDVNFQSPITVVGALRESYRACKRLGWMLRSFEQEILKSEPNSQWATATSYGKPHPGAARGGDLFESYHRAEPAVDPSLAHVRKVEAAGRCTRGLNLSETNFLILRNAHIHGSSWLRDIRIETSPRGIPCETFREYPVRIQLSLPPQRSKILPFYVRIQPRTFLEYSTAELLDRRAFGANASQLILHADANETVETAVVAERSCPVRVRGECVPLWETPNTVTLIARPGATMQINVLELERRVRIIHLERELAGDAWELESPDGKLVALSNLCILDSTCEGSPSTAGRALVQTQGEDFHLWLLTPRPPEISGPGLSIEATYDAEFGLYEAFGRIQFPAKTLSWTKRRKGRLLHWETRISPAFLDGARDVALRLQYQGACARAYLDGRLISDHYFGRFLTWEIGLRDWVRADGALRLEFEDTREVDLKIVPIIESDWQIAWNKNDPKFERHT